MSDQSERFDRHATLGLEHDAVLKKVVQAVVERSPAGIDHGHADLRFLPGHEDEGSAPRRQRLQVGRRIEVQGEVQKLRAEIVREGVVVALQTADLPHRNAEPRAEELRVRQPEERGGGVVDETRREDPRGVDRNDGSGGRDGAGAVARQRVGVEGAIRPEAQLPGVDVQGVLERPPVARSVAPAAAHHALQRLEPVDVEGDAVLGGLIAEPTPVPGQARAFPEASTIGIRRGRLGGADAGPEEGAPEEPKGQRGEWPVRLAHGPKWMGPAPDWQLVFGRKAVAA